jgi:hypothetical protein
MKMKRKSSAYDPTNREHYIFVHGGKETFIDMLPTDKIEEVGPTKVLIRDGKIVGSLADHGLWFKCFEYRVKDGEVWMKISP